MPEREKFDCKDILLIIITCLLIIAVIALCAFVSSYAILNQRTNISDVKTSEACIASESFERELAVNFAMPDSDIVHYDYEEYYYGYADINYSYVNGDLFYDDVITFDYLVANYSAFSNLPIYFQPTGIVYNVVASISPTTDDIWQIQGYTSLMIGCSESNSIYSYSYYTYELTWDWILEERSFYTRNSIFSAGDSIHISAYIDDYFYFYQGMEFEIEYEIEITRIYGYNLTTYIEGEQQNAYDQGVDFGYDNGYGIGYNAGYTAGEGYGYTEGYDDGTEQGYNQGYTEGNTVGYLTGYEEGYSVGEGYGYTEGYDDGTEQGYNQGYTEGYDRGFLVGKNTGFNEGVQQAGDYTFFSLITSVFDAPLRVILGEWVDTNNDGVVDELTGGFLNFYVPVLDIDLAPFILSIFTVCIIIIVIRFVLARL